MAKGIADIAADAGTVANYSRMLANPGQALAGKAADFLDNKLASATNSLSALLPAFPAATLNSPALGLPHAHVAHPPSGPPPVPPTPLPPLGPVLLGTCKQVLINGQPAARCGDIGMNPTCCGLPPLFEIITGSSKVFIGGARAARANIDITMHCKSSAGGGGRAAAKAAKCAAKAAMIAKVAATAAKVSRAAGKVADAAGTVADAAALADRIEEAVASDDVAGMAAQMAEDAAAMAASALMGKDPVVPATGTPGMILQGSPNVLISGLPMPASMAIAQGLMKRVKARKFSGGGGSRSAGRAAPT
jgi:uncharacterized Zn-binding protein involved in type VI secretion